MNNRFSKTTIASCVLGALSFGAVAAPGAPTIDWMESNFALVEVAESGTSYKQVVTVKDFAEVPVKWSKWSGDSGSRVEYRLNGQTVLTQSLSGGGTGTQTGEATLQVAQGGKYDLTVALCDDSGCSESAAKPILVEDTDGSHMDPLVLTPTGSNKPYTNTTNSIVGTYFVEWGVYGRKYTVDMMPVGNLTHIMYGFIPVCGPNDSLKEGNPSGHNILEQSCAGLPDYSLTIHDMFAALQKGQKGASTGSYRGNFGQLMAMKQAYPDVKVLPSIGGWTLSDPFYFLNDAANRKTFVDSCKEFLKTWKFFDGIDIDWEYPGGGGANPNLGDPVNGGATYVTLMQELRVMLDELEAETGRKYELTSAVGAAAAKINKIDYAAASAVMDSIHIMTYDYYGGWDSNKLGHQTGVYPPEFRPGDEQTQQFTLQGALDAIEAKGADMSKVVVGAAMYGRGWSGVSGFAPGASHLTGSGTGPVAGSWEPGVVDYKDIAEYEKSSEWVKYYDTTAQAPYIFKPSTGDLISYDDPQSVIAKGKVVKQRNLKGLFSWEIDADNGDILNAMHEALGHGDPVGNTAPTANAGADQSVNANDPGLTVLDGSGSTDSDADPLTYSWSQVSGTAVALSNASSAQASFDAPAVDEVLVFELTVSDGEYSDTDRVSVTVSTGVVVNNPPTISLPADLSVNALANFSVAATAADPDGDTISVTWDVAAGLTVNSTSNAQADLTAPDVSAATSYTVTATVSDGEFSASDSVVVTVNPVVTNPCDVTDPNAGNYPAWSGNVTYNTGDMVSYMGLVYSAKWWNQNATPSSDGPWKLESTVELPWDAASVYNGGDEVNHEGRRYKAAYWTKGDVPGSAAVWSDIGEASCN